MNFQQGEDDKTENAAYEMKPCFRTQHQLLPQIFLNYYHYYEQ